MINITRAPTRCIIYTHIQTDTHTLVINTTLALTLCVIHTIHRHRQADMINIILALTLCIIYTDAQTDRHKTHTHW